MQFRSKPLVALSIVLVLASALGGWHAPDDRDDQAVPVAHHHADHNAHFAPQTQPSEPEHCALCHWLRAFGSSAPVATHAVASASFELIRVGTLVEPVRNTSRLTLPSRAPPLA